MTTTSALIRLISFYCTFFYFGIFEYAFVTAEKSQFITDIFLKEDGFTKLKKKFDIKPASQRTQTDIDEYNKGIKELNSAINIYNGNNNQINKEREKSLNTWNNSVKKYLDDYMPVQKKV